MRHTFELSERAEHLLATLAAEQGITAEEYLSRFVETWAARLPDEPHDRDQAWFWTPEWQAGEREGDADLAAGRSTRFDGDDALLRALEERAGDPMSDPADADS